MFVFELYLFVETQKRLENYLCFGTYNVCGHTPVHIFAPNGGYIVFRRPHSRGVLSAQYPINFSSRYFISRTFQFQKLTIVLYNLPGHLF